MLDGGHSGMPDESGSPLLTVEEEKKNLKSCGSTWQSPTCRVLLVTGIVLAACGLVLVLVLSLSLSGGRPEAAPSCASGDSSFAVVESVPYGVDLPWPPSAPAQPASSATYNHSTTAAWRRLIQQATASIDLVCFYMTLNATDDASLPPLSPSGDLLTGHAEGMAVYQDLIDAAQRGVAIRVVSSFPTPTGNAPSLDIQRLVQRGLAESRLLNMTAATGGGGVMHTKMMLFDSSSLYLGSANLDWRALTQVKELGLVVTSPCLVSDALRQFDLYWAAARPSGQQSALPSSLSPYAALFSALSPAAVPFDGQQRPSSVFMTASPPSFCAPGRTDDLSAVQGAISSASSALSISLMDYIPATLYASPNVYWPDIDTYIRAAAFNGVRVRMLLSLWNHTLPAELPYWASLDALDNVTVRLMYLPPQPDAPAVPYTRVNHCKFLVSDATVLVTTSNWSGDYFIDTSGASFVSDDPVMMGQVQAVFDRDWDSPYAYGLDSLPLAHWAVDQP